MCVKGSAVYCDFLCLTGLFVRLAEGRSFAINLLGACALFGSTVSRFEQIVRLLCRDKSLNRVLMQNVELSSNSLIYRISVGFVTQL